MSSSFVVDTRFAEAFLNQQHTVLGKPLLPYCCWHKFQLEVINSPVLLGEPVNLINLEHAVAICRSVYPQMASFAAGNTRWQRFKWFWKMRRYQFGREVQKFSTYLDDYASGPKLWEQKGSGNKEPDVDDNLEAVAFFYKQTGCSESDAWMMPLGKLRWYNTMFSRLEGAQVDFWTPDDEVAFQAHVKKREAGIASQAQVYEQEGMEPGAAHERANAEYWAKVNEKLGKL
jgi:hypothetical protein